MLKILVFSLGLGALVLGAESLVRSASNIAATIRISPLVIGLTVVAFGTSLPELAVSVQSALAGQADISIGNVVGSSIFNVLFILGISALIVPLVVSSQLVRFDVPVMIFVSVLVYLMSLDGNISNLEGFILFAGIVAYTLWLLIKGSSTEEKETQVPDIKAPDITTGFNIVKWIMQIFLGLSLLVLGSKWMVDGAVDIAHLFGVNELVIGLTIVAAGTSLPEVATSVAAAIHGERDIAIGNVLGSNIFNMLAVLGVTCLIVSHGLSVSPTALSFDIPVMIAVAVACLPIFFTGNLIARWEGMLFLGYYLIYSLYLFLFASHNTFLPVFNGVMVAFVFPLTFVVLAVSVIRNFRRKMHVP